MVDIKLLKQLIRLMKDNELSELDLRDKEEQITLKRGGGVIYPVSAPPPAGAIAPATPPPAAPTSATDTPAEDANLNKITSPMVGTFYSAPSPDTDAYVKVGASVDDQTVVCIIEAMKVFNEIKAECSGNIEKVLVSDGQAVEFGQPLFLVRPN